MRYRQGDYSGGLKENLTRYRKSEHCFPSGILADETNRDLNDRYIMLFILYAGFPCLWETGFSDKEVDNSL